MPLSELKPHLFTLPDHPDWIPYRTSYYKEELGILPDAPPDAGAARRRLRGLHRFDARGRPSDLRRMLHARAHSTDEVLISCHACHPSLANDNLVRHHRCNAPGAASCPGKKLRYSYRFLFLPGTIGAITWLAQNRETAGRIRHGLVLTGIGDAGGFHYKKSRGGATPKSIAPRRTFCATAASARDSGIFALWLRRAAVLLPGLQSCRRLPDAQRVGHFSRVPHLGRQSGFHPAACNLRSRCASVRAIFDVLENNRRYRNQNPYCEPQLGKRNLYRSTGGECHWRPRSTRACGC